MNPESENFDRLRTLLALKRHEVPPPGYFRSFPAKVIARIEAGEQAVEAPWWQQLAELRWLRPGLAMSCGAATCLALLAGAALLREAQEPSAAPGTVLEGAIVSMPPHPLIQPVLLGAPGLATGRGLLLTNASPASEPPAFLFNDNGLFARPQVVPVGLRGL